MPATQPALRDQVDVLRWEAVGPGAVAKAQRCMGRSVSPVPIRCVELRPRADHMLRSEYTLCDEVYNEMGRTARSGAREPRNRGNRQRAHQTPARRLP